MALESVTNLLLIKPKPGDSEETKQQKEVINHAIQTYFQFSAMEKLADTLFSQFVPKQVMLNRVTNEELNPHDAYQFSGVANDAKGLLKILTSRKFMPGL